MPVTGGAGLGAGAGIVGLTPGDSITPPSQPVWALKNMSELANMPTVIKIMRLIMPPWTEVVYAFATIITPGAAKG